MYIPKEIVEKIIQFKFDKRGYEIFNYYKKIEKNEHKINRIIKEIKYWNSLQVSVSWLKSGQKQKNKSKEFFKSLRKKSPKILYHIGSYYNIQDEVRCSLNFF